MNIESREIDVKYLNSSYYFDFNSSQIQEIIQEFDSNELSDKDKAKGLYLKVRDGWRYNPYHLSFAEESYKASAIAEKPEGHCIDKSILYVAGLRALGVPARLHLAKVKNHIGVERLIEKFGKNELSPHGMVDVFLNQKWIKVSPIFNLELCKKCNVAPLEFDGENDSVFQEFDKDGSKFMEYLEDYGHFEDVPVKFIFDNFKTNYPAIVKSMNGNTEIRI